MVRVGSGGGCRSDIHPVPKGYLLVVESSPGYTFSLVYIQVLTAERWYGGVRGEARGARGTSMDLL